MRTHFKQSPTVLKLLLFVVGCIGLGWLVIAHSYVAYLAEVDPEASLRIRTNARAQINLVERRLAEMRLGPEAGQPVPAETARSEASLPTDRVRGLAELAARGIAQERELATASSALVTRPPAKEALYQMVRDALSRDPLDAKGLRLLGQLSEGHAPREEIARLMRMAVRRNVHESMAVLWLMNHALSQRDYPDVVRQADTLLRTQSRLTQHAVNALARVSEDPHGLALVVDAVRASPPWRKAFFAQFPQFVTDARVPLQIFLSLKDASIPLRAEDLRAYMDMLWRNKLFDLAYYTWVQFLPPEPLARVATPFNGDFAEPLSGLPFDWTIPKSPNVFAAVVAKPDARRGNILRIEFGLGRIEFAGVSQFLLLPPGPYAFAAQHLAQINARRGLVWAVTCVDGPELGRSGMIVGSNAAWTSISFAFEVPKASCPAQQVRLFHDARTPSEQLASGWSLHDDVRIVRTDTR